VIIPIRARMFREAAWDGGYPVLVSWDSGGGVGGGFGWRPPGGGCGRACVRAVSGVCIQWVGFVIVAATIVWRISARVQGSVCRWIFGFARVLDKSAADVEGWGVGFGCPPIRGRIVFPVVILSVLARRREAGSRMGGVGGG